MPGKIFVNYRRDDVRDMAARVRDRLAQTFGGANVFMDVDNLMAGQRFDRELEKALAQTDIFLAVIGPRWMDLFAERRRLGERDYVHEEIAGALKRGIVVIPVLIERASLPRGEALPEDIRDLVLHQKHDVSHEQFGQNTAALVEAIRFARKSGRAPMAIPTVRMGTLGLAVAASVVGAAMAYSGAYYAGVPVPWPWSISIEQTLPIKDGIWVSRPVDRQVLAAVEIEKERQARSKAEDEAKAAAARREVERLAALKVEEDRQRAAAEAKRRADEDAARWVPQPGQTFRDCTDGCPEMVVVPAGEFTMGSNDGDNYEKPPHRVTIRQPFAVGKFEVTFDEWDACVAAKGCQHKPETSWGRGRQPVMSVSWNDAKEYVSWLSRKTGKSYRLLSEAEWEYAARAGTTTRYSWGNDIDCSKASYDGGEKSSCYYYPGGKFRGTQAVGSYAANAFGLFDMDGNVREWCEDTWHSNYQGAPADGSAWTSGGTSSRVLRGGAWYLNSSYLRSAGRSYNQPGDRSSFVGFRVARTL